MSAAPVQIWRKAVLDDQEVSSQGCRADMWAVLAAMVVSVEFDAKGSGAFCGINAIARRMRCSPRQAAAALAHAKRRGWLAWNSGGGRVSGGTAGQANEYRADWSKFPQLLMEVKIGMDNVLQFPRAVNLAETCRVKDVNHAETCMVRGVNHAVVCNTLDKEKRENGGAKSSEENEGDYADIVVNGFTIPAGVVRYAARATGIPEAQARDLASANAHEWAATGNTPRSVTAVLATAFTSFRDSSKAGRGGGGQAADRKPSGQAQLKREQIVERIEGFYRYGCKPSIWGKRLRAAVGPAPGEAGCRLDQALIDEGRVRAEAKTAATVLNAGRDQKL
jgi:hypothetical protein